MNCDMSSEVQEVLQGLNERFEQLVSLHEVLLVKYNQLCQEKREQDLVLAEQSKSLGELNEKNQHLLLSQAIAHTGESNEEAKEKIDTIVREIDKCMLLLGK
ncbi:hypothetical protein FACS1894156_8770 [Bacteroidia bacterium]|nr:hypothetical protein FACS1894156_8770 [Bacteroidia bacterium]